MLHRKRSEDLFRKFQRLRSRFFFYLVGVPVRKNYFMSGCKCFDLFLKLAVAEGNRGAGRDVQRRIGMKSDTLENGAEDRRLRNIEISVII